MTVRATAFLGFLVISGVVASGVAALAYADRTAGFAVLVRVVYPTFYIFLLGITLSYRAVLAAVLARHALPACGTAFCVLSCLWSVESDISARRVGLLLGATLFAYFTTATLSLQRVLGFVVACILLITVLSGLIGLAFPDIAFGTDTAGRYFQGLMMHRNDLGRLAMIGVCSLLALALLNRFSWPLWRVALLLILVGLLLLTRSITSLLTTLMLIVTYLAVVDRVLLLRFAIALMTVLVVAVAIASPELLVSAVGKDATLTGRTQLWVWAWERIKEAPYLGHGYYALFNHLGLETGWYDLFPGMGFDTGLAHPHNGFLMIALDGGWPLLAIVIAMLVVQLRNSAALLHFGHPYGGVGLLFVVMQTVYNVTEVSFFRLNDLMWTLSLIVYIKVAAVHGQLIAGSSARLPLSSPSTGAMLVPAERRR